MSFADRNILITGAASGFGRAVAAELLRSGAHVFALDRSAEGLKSLTTESAADEKMLKTICADISDWAGVEKALADLPAMDGLVNSAGIGRNFNDLTPTSFLEMDESEFDVMYAVNFKGSVRVTQCVVKKMLNAQVEAASIVNVSSLSSLKAWNDLLPYSAAKAALDNFTRCLARELGPNGIRVNAVNPHTCAETAMGRPFYDWMGERREKVLEGTPMGRFLKAEELVEVILFLLSGKSSFLNGLVLPVDGGVMA